MTGSNAAVTGPPSAAIRAAAVMYIVLGLGFGAGAVVTLAALARGITVRDPFD